MQHPASERTSRDSMTRADSTRREVAPIHARHPRHETNTLREKKGEYTHSNCGNLENEQILRKITKVAQVEALRFICSASIAAMIS